MYQLQKDPLEEQRTDFKRTCFIFGAIEIIGLITAIIGVILLAMDITEVVAYVGFSIMIIGCTAFGYYYCAKIFDRNRR